MKTNTFDITVSTFQQIVIEGSKESPILITFWSNQDPDCLALLSMIDEIHAIDPTTFVNARVNCDVEDKIVAHFGITNVPSVFIFKDGVAVDGFAGLQDKQFIEEFINKHTPDPADALLSQGQTLFAQGLLEEAKSCLLTAQEMNNENNQIKLALAQVYLALAAIDNARTLLEKIPMKDQDAIYNSLMSQLELAIQSAQTPEITALENALIESDGDKKVEIQYQLAIQYSQQQRNEDSLALLFSILSAQLDYENGEAKKTMLDILATTDDATLVSVYRRKLYSLLY